MSGVTPTKVRSVISTDAEDSVLETFIGDAEADVERTVDADALDADHEDRLVRWYAAYLLRSVRDRAIESGKRKSVSISYDGSALDELRQRVRDLDPSGELCPPSGVIRRESDHVGSARPHSRDGIGDRGPRRERR